MPPEFFYLLVDLLPAGVYAGGFYYLHRVIVTIQSAGCPACRTQRCIDCDQIRDAEKRLL